MTAGVTFTPLQPKQHIIISNATVLFEPSVYGGNGTETRVNLVLRAQSLASGGAALEAVRSIEASLGLDSRYSVAKGDDTIKCKLVLDEVRTFDAEHAAFAVPSPAQWKGALVNARLEVRGSWQSRLGSGLSIVCTDVQFLGGTTAVAPPAVSPFLEPQAIAVHC
jgi:hypothetical protein